ncbi:lysophospholipid acyltransferase family protein [Azomonas macrocytogenes]|uniref:1-acyl-sn-glycerol-3-phosphate acyltransferase n=1 Tax=Azomonas macrocytogenes TaxID=69962 RepID=A0A839SXP5_AZOMA|nr:lysophospholipid acyltransferase family protein [Azomonas macrocytogenes]MBB3101688.1 1-acyl-sn-glycerol-3-phosphate acyltransferase [Azomonas macrocytogenes]
MRIIQRYLSYSRLIALMAAGLAMAIWFHCVACLVPVSLARRQRATRWFLARMVAALPLRVQLSGTLPERPALWLANHISWTDIPLLGQWLPMSFLSKDDVRQWPIAGWLAQESGTLFIRRGSGDLEGLHRQLADYLRQGHPLLIFPEGTTTDGSQVGIFHSRLLSCATATGVPVQPVAIRYLRRGQRDSIAPFIGADDLLSHLRRLLAHEPVDVEIHLLPLIETAGRNRSGIAREAREGIKQALQFASGSEEKPSVAA